MADTVDNKISSTGNWGDDPEDSIVDSTSFIEGPDENGVYTHTDVVMRDGKRIKIVKKIRKTKRTVKVNKRAEERQKNWKCFGKALERDQIGITVPQQPEAFDISGTHKTQSVVEKKIDKEIENMMRQSQARAEGMEVTDKFVPKSLRPGGGRGPTLDAKPTGAEPVGNAYRPPSMRGSADAGGRTMSREDTHHTVRVTNLSEEITEQDLRDLFGSYGALQRVFLAKDRKNGESKGFAFINFYKKEEAERAIEKVSGFGYNHLILQVEWAKPSGS